MSLTREDCLARRGSRYRQNAAFETNTQRPIMSVMFPFDLKNRLISRGG